MKKNCLGCKKDIELPDDKQYIKYCAECYRKKQSETQPKDPYEQGMEDNDRISPVETGMVYNNAVKCHLKDGLEIEKHFERLKKIFLGLKEKHQK